jgi:hypothetical protein
VHQQSSYAVRKLVNALWRLYTQEAEAEHNADIEELVEDYVPPTEAQLFASFVTSVYHGFESKIAILAQVCKEPSDEPVEVKSLFAVPTSPVMASMDTWNKLAQLCRGFLPKTMSASIFS